LWWRASVLAAAAAATLAAELGAEVGGASNREAARQADVVVVAVPFASQLSVLEEIRPGIGGKVVIDTTVPLVPPTVARVQLPPEGSAAQRAQKLLGADVKLVSAFHNVAAHKLATDEEVECDVLVFGDDKAARAVAVELATLARLRGLHAGALANAAAGEALTSILIFMNKTYRVDGAGIRITGQLIMDGAGE
jgi:NADPH-dependent F420 reductase